MIIIILRTLIVFISIVASMRLMGKRQLGQLELSELVVAFLIADLASHPLQDIGIPLLNGLLPVVILLCCELLFSGLLLWSVRARTILCGKPSILVRNGEINQYEMNKNRFTVDELLEKLRSRNITNIASVKYAILETDGTLNALLFPGERPVTARQMNIQTDDVGYTTVIINNGRILRKNLDAMEKDDKWLDKELRSRKIKSPKDVYLLSVNHAGQVYCNVREGARK